MKKSIRLKFNDLAPDCEILTTSGDSILLSSLWQAQPLLLNFLRHFGCPQCKQMMDMLSEWQPELKKRGVGIGVITQANAEQTKEFCAIHAPNLSCFCDPKREAYKAYGLPRGGLHETFLSLRVWRENGRARREKGYRVELPPAGQDAFQMAGTFVIGTDGHIRLPYYYEDIADHPLAELAFEGVLSTNWNTPFDAPLGS